MMLGVDRHRTNITLKNIESPSFPIYFPLFPIGFVTFSKKYELYAVFLAVNTRLFDIIRCIVWSCRDGSQQTDETQ